MYCARSHAWLSRHFSDKFVKASKYFGYRSRAWFKLDEIQKINNIITPGMTVLDLGSSPGGWSQYASRKVSKLGHVISCDIKPMLTIPRVSFILGDAFKKDILNSILKINSKIDVTCLSDMAKNLILWLIIAVVLMSVFQSFGPSDSNRRKVDYSTFMSELNQEQIKETRINGREVIVFKKDGSKYITYIPINDPKLLDILLSKNVKIVGEPPEEPSLLTSIFISWFPMLLLIGVWIFFMRQMQGGSGKGAMSFGKSKARMLTEDQIKTTFLDVAGCDEAKEE
uniref:rRNA methyltransferase 2, mitochondrial n=1 Tax=Glossina pallidipes TaxID=7398 RepID=A0A1A9Z1H9_GLOPL